MGGGLEDGQGLKVWIGIEETFEFLGRASFGKNVGKYRERGWRFGLGDFQCLKIGLSDRDRLIAAKAVFGDVRGKLENLM